MAVEAVPARGNDRVLELEYDVIRQASRIGEITRDSPNSSDETIVGVQANRNLLGTGHG